MLDVISQSFPASLHHAPMRWNVVSKPLASSLPALTSNPFIDIFIELPAAKRVSCPFSKNSVVLSHHGQPSTSGQW